MIFSTIKYYQFLILIVLSHTGYFALAQNQFSFKSFNVKHGLSHNFCRNVIQDTSGFLWIATADGLNKFDGHNFRVFRNNPEDSNSISRNNINFMEVDKYGKLWLGTWGGGINIFDPLTEQVTRLPLELNLDGDKINISFINILFRDSKGNIWAGINEAGLFKYNIDDYSCVAYQHKSGVKNGLSRNRVMGISEDKQGNIWIATLGGGLNQLNPKTHQFTIYDGRTNHPDSLNNDQVYSVLADSKNRIWVGSWGGGLYRMDLETRKFKSYQTNIEDQKSLKSQDVWFMKESIDGKIWIGSDKGLALFNEKADNFTVFMNDQFNNQSIPANSIKAISEDKEGRLWLGTFNGGIAFLDLKQKYFKHYFKKNNKPNSLSSNDITSFWELENGEILVGTDGGGLNSFNLEKETFRKIIRDTKDGVLGDKVKCIFGDHKNRIWIGYWGGGLDLFDPKTQTFKNYGPEKNSNTGPNSNNIMSIAEDRNGILWVGTFGGGLNKFDPEKGIFKYFNQIPNNNSSLADINIWDIVIDQTGKLLLGTSNGFLDYFDPEEEKFTHIRAFENTNTGFTPQAILEDKSGKIWLGTTGGGLQLLNKKDFSLTQFYRNYGLVNGNIKSVIEDLNGTKWLGTNHGISKFKYDSLQFINYDVSDGLQDLHFNRASVFKLKSGELLFGGVNGFNIFHPDSIPELKDKKPLVISNFQIFNQDVKVGVKDSPLSKNISLTKEIVLNYNHDVISFEYALITFSGAEKTRYAYQLENFTHPKWQYVGKERKATYTNLKPGNYVFRVRATTNGVDWPENEVSLSIKVLPPWWGTWWFRILAVVSVIFLGVLFYKVRFNFLEKQRKALEMQVKLRTEELNKSNQLLQVQKAEINLQNEELQSSQEELHSQNQELSATLEKLREAQGQLVQSEKMASLGILTAGIAHEINNPINFINAGVIGLKKTLNNIFLLLHKYGEITPENVEDKLKEIQKYMDQIQFNHTLELLLRVSDNISIGVERTTEIIKGLKIFSRQDNQKIDNYNIHNGIDSTLLLISSQFKDRIKVVKNYNPIPEIKVCPGKINQVFMNILINAFQAIEGEGEVTISTSKNGRFAKIAIKDNGSGMELETSKQIFDPFFTTKEVGKGTGLGLFISHGILEEHGGEIKVKSELGNGTEFTIYLPL